MKKCDICGTSYNEEVQDINFRVGSQELLACPCCIAKAFKLKNNSNVFSLLSVQTQMSDTTKLNCYIDQILNHVRMDLGLGRELNEQLCKDYFSSNGKASSPPVTKVIKRVKSVSSNRKAETRARENKSQIMAQDFKTKWGNHNPKMIFKELRKSIFGQDESLKKVSVAAFLHLKSIMHPSLNSAAPNIMIAGPTGCGKTAMVEALASYLQLPTISVSAPNIVAAGYKGETIEDVFTRYLAKAGGSILEAEVGIVYLDEVDKLAKRSDSLDMRISTQEALLKVIQGCEVKVGDSVVNSKNILFIASGAFEGIESIINPKKKKIIGMGLSGEGQEIEPENKMKGSHLVEFGMTKEFIGRFKYLVSFNQLSEDDLFSISKNSPSSPVKSFVKLLEKNGQFVHVDDSFHRVIAKRAASHPFGARAVDMVCSELVEDLLFHYDEIEDDLVLDEEWINAAVKS